MEGVISAVFEVLNFGAIMVLAGIGMLIAMGLGLLDTPSWREGGH